MEQEHADFDDNIEEPVKKNLIELAAEVGHVIPADLWHLEQEQVLNKYDVKFAREYAEVRELSEEHRERVGRLMMKLRAYQKKK